MLFHEDMTLLWRILDNLQLIDQKSRSIVLGGRGGNGGEKTQTWQSVLTKLATIALYLSLELGLAEKKQYDRVPTPP